MASTKHQLDSSSDIVDTKWIRAIRLCCKQASPGFPTVHSPKRPTDPPGHAAHRALSGNFSKHVVLTPHAGDFATRVRSGCPKSNSQSAFHDNLLKETTVLCQIQTLAADRVG